ncbi:hypothetical protein ACERIT_13075 [Halopenitus sp. H-Gu1]|uniref:hypothetical protein n=1 Tax=Halopenitus sp. H-Gu1 TaxID=3242697 RepID=UPI00359E6D59
MSSTEIIQKHTERWTASQQDRTRQYVPEKYQLGILVDFLDELGVRYATEKSIFSYPIDLLCVNRDETMAIEMKSRNIGKGIDQALRNSDYVDYSFLAIWEEDLSDSLIKRVSDLPIGLMAIDGSVNIVSGPQKSGQQLYSNARVVELVGGNVRKHDTIQ